ncbi:MAG: HlyD family type I secretion periplasmic adaptor subunit [Gemmobacter sp.]
MSMACTSPRTDTGRIIGRGALYFVLLFGVLAGWAGFAMIGGAVVASGHVLVRGKAQPVQSLDGGLVAAVLVASGDRVAAGDVILSLDPTVAAVRLDITRARLAEALALRARFTAEAEGESMLTPGAPALPFSLPDLEAAMTSQRAIMSARAARKLDGRTRLTETTAQIAAQTAGIAAQEDAARTEAALVAGQIATQADLMGKGLARQAPLDELRRQEAALAGRLAGFAAERDRLAGAAREAALVLRQQEGERVEEVAQGLRDASAMVAELVQEGVSLQAELARAQVRAPVAGVVHELAVVVPGAVIAPGAVLAQVVPIERGVEIEVMIDPRAIDQVWQGQSAEVMIGALDPRATPKLRAEVAAVPPGAVTDPATGRSFYRIALHLPETEIARLGSVTLTPGMPVEAYLATGERSALSWLMAPLAAPFNRALREN